MYGVTAYTVGNVNTGLANDGVPLAMAMQGLTLPRIVGGVPIIKTALPVNTALVPMNNGVPMVVAGGVDATGMSAVPMYTQQVQQVRGKPSAYAGQWKKIYTGDGGKYWVNNITGQVSIENPFM